MSQPVVNDNERDDDDEGTLTPGLADRMDMDPDGIEWLDDDE